MIPTAETLRLLFHYSPEDGVFTRLKQVDARFPVGQTVGHRASNGYVRFTVAGYRTTAHRLAWLYMTGEWPTNDIDHIDGDRTNNRWSNLRHVSRSVNLQNIRQAKSHNRSTGLLGAYQCGARFTSRIQILGKDKYLGVFATAQEAHLAYLREKRQSHEGNTL